MKARLTETNHIAQMFPKEQQVAVVTSLNDDPFWESIFDGLEAQIRAIDPDHEYLPENQISV